MKHLSTALLSSGFLLTLLWAGQSQAATNDRFANIEIETVPLGNGIYMLVGSGGHMGVSSGDDGVIIIDDQYGPLSEKIAKAISALHHPAADEAAATDSRPAFILNTHYHGDHVGGNVRFGADGVVVAHENVRVRLIAGETTAPALPVLTYEESITIYFNDEAISVTHLPKGHTDGDSVVYFPRANVLHAGDHMFNGLFPYVDLDAGGSVQGYTDNVSRILDMIDANTRVIPGHGPLASRSDLSSFHNMLTTTSSLIRDAMREGKTLPQIKAQGLGPDWESWSWSFISEERWIETVYTSYSR